MRVHRSATTQEVLVALMRGEHRPRPWPGSVDSTAPAGARTFFFAFPGGEEVVLADADVLWSADLADDTLTQSEMSFDQNEPFPCACEYGACWHRTIGYEDDYVSYRVPEFTTGVVIPAPAMDVRLTKFAAGCVADTLADWTRNQDSPWCAYGDTEVVFARTLAELAGIAWSDGWYTLGEVVRAHPALAGDVETHWPAFGTALAALAARPVLAWDHGARLSDLATRTSGATGNERWLAAHQVARARAEEIQATTPACGGCVDAANHWTATGETIPCPVHKGER